MPNPEELKDLGRTLALTVARLQEVGVFVRLNRGFVQTGDWRVPSLNMVLQPMNICDTCNRWSPADKCLWCEEE